VNAILCLWEVSDDCNGRAEYGVREKPEPDDDPMLFPIWPACDPCAMMTRNDDPLAEVIPLPDWLREEQG